MKHLYSVFAALLLFFLSPIAGFAQRNNAKPKSVITRTIVGCTLGETTLEQIKENVQAQGGEIENFSDETDGPRMKTIVVSGLRFWGETRDKIMMKTVDSILYLVIILIPDKAEADRLKNNLILKYRGWEDNTDIPSKSYDGSYVDSRSTIMLSYKNDGPEYSRKFKYAMLMYADNALFNKAREIESSDL
jgi:hypothetical protein|nr:MAG TPA: hypothetical protein [Caudoviricetes sp.]